jgi:hypothetical protein
MVAHYRSILPCDVPIPCLESFAQVLDHAGAPAADEQVIYVHSCGALRTALIQSVEHAWLMLHTPGSASTETGYRTTVPQTRRNRRGPCRDALRCTPLSP